MFNFFINYFKNYKYSKLLIAKFFELYSFYSLRSVLVLVFVISLNLNDSDAFQNYTTFVVCGDLVSIIGAYFGDRLLTRRISLVLGMIFSCFGYIYSYFNFNFFGICIGLIFAGLGMGLSRVNSNVIINDYIQEEINENQRHNHNGAFHITTIIALLLGFIINGIIVQSFDHKLIFLASGISMLLSMAVFLFFEFKNLHSEIILTFLKHPINDHNKKNNIGFFENFNWYKFFFSNFLIVFSLIISGILYFIIQNYKDFFLAKNIKILIIIAVFCIVIFLLKKSKDYFLKEKQAILSLILYIPYYLIYMAFEKQLDMNFALYLFRAVDRHIFNFEIPPSNITSIFSLTILFISFFFVKKSIYSYFKHNTVLLLAFFTTILHFLFNVIGLRIALYYSSSVNIIFPILSLISLALADIFILPRMYSLCRMVPESIKSFSSSLMMLSHGSGFYLAGFLAQLAAIRNSETIQKQEVLNVYYESFTVFMIIGIILFISIFILNKSRLGLLLSRK